MQPLCREAPLYVSTPGVNAYPDSIAYECEHPELLLGTGGTQAAGNTLEHAPCDIIGTPVRGAGLTEWSLDESGTLLPGAHEGTVRIVGGENVANVDGESCSAFGQAHLGGWVIGQYDCGAVPAGEGGTLAPGAYVLTGFVAHTRDSAIPSNNITQTLYVTPTAAVLVASDTVYFDNVSAYRLAITGNELELTPTCEQVAQRTFWTLKSTFTTDGTVLDLFSAEGNYRARFQRVGDLEYY